eukprot:g15539.t1
MTNFLFHIPFEAHRRMVLPVFFGRREELKVGGDFYVDVSDFPVVFAHDFASPHHLAGFLQKLSQHPPLYHDFFRSWASYHPAVLQATAGSGDAGSGDAASFPAASFHVENLYGDAAGVHDDEEQAFQPQSPAGSRADSLLPIILEHVMEVGEHDAAGEDVGVGNSNSNRTTSILAVDLGAEDAVAAAGAAEARVVRSFGLAAGANKNKIEPANRLDYRHYDIQFGMGSGSDLWLEAARNEFLPHDYVVADLDTNGGNGNALRDVHNQIDPFCELLSYLAQQGVVLKLSLNLLEGLVESGFLTVNGGDRSRGENRNAPSTEVEDVITRRTQMAGVRALVSENLLGGAAAGTPEAEEGLLEVLREAEQLLQHAAASVSDTSNSEVVLVKQEAEEVVVGNGIGIHDGGGEGDLGSEINHAGARAVLAAGMRIRARREQQPGSGPGVDAATFQLEAAVRRVLVNRILARLVHKFRQFFGKVQLVFDVRGARRTILSEPASSTSTSRMESDVDDDPRLGADAIVASLGEAMFVEEVQGRTVERLRLYLEGQALLIHGGVLTDGSAESVLDGGPNDFVPEQEFELLRYMRNLESVFHLDENENSASQLLDSRPFFLVLSQPRTDPGFAGERGRSVLDPKTVLVQPDLPQPVFGRQESLAASAFLYGARVYFKQLLGERKQSTSSEGLKNYETVTKVSSFTFGSREAFFTYLLNPGADHVPGFSTYVKGGTRRREGLKLNLNLKDGNVCTPPLLDHVHVKNARSEHSELQIPFYEDALTLEDLFRLMHPEPPGSRRNLDAFLKAHVLVGEAARGAGEEVEEQERHNNLSQVPSDDVIVVDAEVEKKVALLLRFVFVLVLELLVCVRDGLVQHNDLWSPNILFVPKYGKLVAIDWQLAQIRLSQKSTALPEKLAAVSKRVLTRKDSGQVSYEKKEHCGEVLLSEAELVEAVARAEEGDATILSQNAEALRELFDEDDTPPVGLDPLDYRQTPGGNEKESAEVVSETTASQKLVGRGLRFLRKYGFEGADQSSGSSEIFPDLISPYTPFVRDEHAARKTKSASPEEEDLFYIEPRNDAHMLSFQLESLLQRLALELDGVGTTTWTWGWAYGVVTMLRGTAADGDCFPEQLDATRRHQEAELRREIEELRRKNQDDHDAQMLNL